MANMSRRDFLKNAALAAAGVAVADKLVPAALAEVPGSDIQWDYEADVVVLGAGGAGLPAALKAMEDGASVLLVEANWDCGGHAAVSEGNLHSGANIEQQQQYGIQDSADLYYFDHTRGVPYTTRYNDRAQVRSIANAMHESFVFFQQKGLVVKEGEPTGKNYYKDKFNAFEPESVPRQTNADATGWDNPFTGTAVNGIGVTRPLEKTLREQGASFLLNYHMDKIYREGQFSGKVLGIKASYTPHIMPGQTEPLKSVMSEGNIDCTKETVNIRAKKGVIIATGGSTGNVHFRTMFDPRIGPEFDSVGGMPFSDQDASGEMAAMEIGAALGSAAGYINEAGGWLTTPQRFGCRYGYGKGFTEKSWIWPLVHANGIKPDYTSLIIVNMLGKRCGNEDKYNTNKYVEDRFEFFNTAFSSVFIDPEGDGNAECLTGPLWAIMDAGAAERNDWVMEDGVLDFENGYAFKGDTIEELAQNIVNKYHEEIKMDPAVLAETIRKYNEAVEIGYDDDWGKTSLDHKIEKGPFYALWAMPSLHDTLAGLRTNGQMQVVDMHGELIPNLFCAGEAAGGMRIHGLGRVMTAGYVAGRAAASVDENGIATASTALNPEYAGYETSSQTVTDTRYDVTYISKEDKAAFAAAKAAAMEEHETAQAAGEAVDGDVYIGTSDNGMGGPVQVQITVKDGKMTNIEVIKQSETPDIGVPAFDTLIQNALSAQSSAVDSVSGATVTSEAFCDALQKAMKKAGL